MFRRRSRGKATRRNRPTRRPPGEKPAGDKPAGDKLPPEDKPAEKPAEKKASFRIDFEGLQYRILDLPIPAGQLSNLQTGAAGHIYYLRTADGRTSLNRYDLNARKNEVLVPEASDYIVSADAKKLMYRNANNWSIVPTTKPAPPAEGRIAVDTIEVRVDPQAEWKQIFDEAWRINRDYFYAPNMHGVDWAKQKAKYASVSAARRHPRGSESRAAVDVERAGGRAPQRRRRRQADRAAVGAGRAPRRRLRGRRTGATG